MSVFRKLVACMTVLSFMVASASAFVVPSSSGVFVSTSSSAFVSPSPRPARLQMADPTVLEPPTKEKEKVKEETPSKAKARKGSEGWAVRLYNDPMNKREFVARCLMEVCGLSDTQSYQVMMQAHNHGIAIVGRYHQERAELYRNRLVENGLVCDMIPVDDE